MSRAGALAAGLVAIAALAGCQTEVMTAVADAERAFQEKQREAAEAREQREALREAYGVPKRAAWP